MTGAPFEWVERRADPPTTLRLRVDFEDKVRIELRTVHAVEVDGRPGEEVDQEMIELDGDQAVELASALLHRSPLHGPKVHAKDQWWGAYECAAHVDTPTGVVFSVRVDGHAAETRLCPVCGAPCVLSAQWPATEAGY